MFTPSQSDVRRFFCAAYAKYIDRNLSDPLETLAAQWIAEHPEYFKSLQNVEEALTLDFNPYDEQENPFLHLSMHLSISEQCSIDQPSGIRQAIELLCAKRGDLHAAHHEVMQCLGVMIWESQRSGRPPDGLAYLEAVQRCATRD